MRLAAHTLRPLIRGCPAHRLEIRNPRFEITPLTPMSTPARAAASRPPQKIARRKEKLCALLPQRLAPPFAPAYFHACARKRGPPLYW